ncbi:hypothetical protein ANTPLA_LOCUS10247 [Anthophora plagiata]
MQKARTLTLTFLKTFSPRFPQLRYCRGSFALDNAELTESFEVRSAGGHMVKQRRFIGNTNNKMINIREYL